MSYGAALSIWYSVANVLPVVRGIAMQWKPFTGLPVSACSTVFQRFGVGNCDSGEMRVASVHVVTGGVPFATTQFETSQAFCVLASGRVPSTIRSIEPELSTRRRT